MGDRKKKNEITFEYHVILDCLASSKIENCGLDYQLFWKAVRTFLIERSSMKIAQNSCSPFTKMTFGCSESNFFQHSPFPNSYKEINQWSYNFPNYFYINSTKDIMWKRHYTLSEIHIFTCSFQCMKQSSTIYSIVEIGQSFPIYI